MTRQTRPPPDGAKEKPQTVLQHRLRQTDRCLVQDSKAYFMNTSSLKRIRVWSFSRKQDHTLASKNQDLRSSEVHRGRRSALVNREEEGPGTSRENLRVTYSDLFDPPILDKTETGAQKGKKSDCAGADKQGQPASLPEQGTDEGRAQYRGQHPFDYPIGNENPSRDRGGDSQ